MSKNATASYVHQQGNLIIIIIIIISIIITEQRLKFFINLIKLLSSYRSIDLAVRVFANGPGDWGSVLSCHTEDSKNGT